VGRVQSGAAPVRKPADADDAVRGRLLSAALELFQDKGYASTTVREIVAAAGVTKPVLYYHFGNKEGIYLAILREAFAPFQAALDPALDPPGPVRGRIEALCERVFQLFKTLLPAARLMYSIYYGPPQGAPPFDFDATHFLFQGRLRALLGEGRRAGEFAFVKTEDAMWAIIGALNIAMEVELCHPGQSLSPREFRRVLAIVLDGMKPRTSSPAGEGRARSTGRTGDTRTNAGRAARPKGASR
jgi:TetR/AcrR family transcriptional regulator